MERSVFLIRPLILEKSVNNDESEENGLEHRY